MSFLLGNEAIFIPLFGITMFIFSYFTSDKILDYLHRKSLGSREDVLQLMDKMFIDTDRTKVTYAITQPFAKTVADLLAQQHPTLIVSKMSKNLRNKKVFIDWSQNADFKTTVGVYSLRAKSAEPFVSLPVTWQELESAMKRKDSQSLYFKWTKP